MTYEPLPFDRRRLFSLVPASFVACFGGPRPSGFPDGASSGDASVAAIPTRELGQTGVRVSMLGLGGYHVGKISGDEESIRVVRSSIERGITFLDNCWDYNGGASEERMGRALQNGYRKRAFLMTKIDGRTKQAAAAQLDQSLKRLRTDHIDLVQIHEVIRATDPERCFREGCVEALIEAKKAGKLRFIGFTGHKHPDLHNAMLDMADAQGFRFDTVQMPLNVMDPHFRSFEKNVLPRLVEKKIGVLGMKSMASGSILKATDVTPVECLTYALSLPTSVVITGCDSMEILDQAVRVGQTFKPLTEAAKAELLARTASIANEGMIETFKTTRTHDGTANNPKWLEMAEL